MISPIKIVLTEALRKKEAEIEQKLNWVESRLKTIAEFSIEANTATKEAHSLFYEIKQLAAEISKGGS